MLEVTVELGGDSSEVVQREVGKGTDIHVLN